MYTKGEWMESQSLTGERLIYSESGDCEIICSNVRNWNKDIIIAAPDCYEGLKDALKEICRLCVEINPQHKNCTSCEEMERSRLPLLKAEGRNA